MDETIEFSTVLDLVSTEVVPPSGDPDNLSADAVDRFLEAVGGSALVGIPLLLAEPLGSPDGKAALLGGGADLAGKMLPLLKRQFKSPDQPIGPVLLKFTPELAGHFKALMAAKIDPILEQVLSTENTHYGRISRGLPAADLETAQNIVKEIIDQTVSTPPGVTTMLGVNKNRANATVLERSLNVCLISMAVLRSLRRRQSSGHRSGDQREELQRVAGAGLFMDTAVMLNPSLYQGDVKRHPIRSAQIARELGLDDAAADAIENHHKIEGADGKPIMLSQEEELSTCARVLVVVTMFVAALHSREEPRKEIEVIKILHHIAAEGHVDGDVVKQLTKLYFSKKYAIFLEHAEAIRRQCISQGPDHALLWNMLGERTPYKFICRNDECPQLGSQVTDIITTIPITIDGAEVAKIKKGGYLNCMPLTTALETLHRELASITTN